MATKLSRRKFLQGCSAAIAALAGSRISQVAFAAPGAQSLAAQHHLVVIFLRGGWDALNIFPVLDGPDRGFYEAARPSLKIPASALKPLNDTLGMHPAMAPLFELYQEGKLAVVQACGLQHDTRSHFDAMEFMELGTPGSKSSTSGWLTRALQTDQYLNPQALMPVLASGGQPTAVLGQNNTVAMQSASDFSLWSSGDFRPAQKDVLRRMYAGDDWLQVSGTRLLNALDVMENAGVSEYVPANGAQYPGDYFSTSLQTVAQVAKLDLGLRVSTVDLGGWDTHEYQGDGAQGYFGDLLGQLAGGLSAFYTDLGERAQNTTVVVMSEFGRRLVQNASYGTDHGHGSAMLVLGGNVNGGQVYGSWPGLSNEQLYDRADLAVTTDYRQVLSEIVSTQLGNNNIESYFPGYSANYQPLGIVK
jgi:uncharacterized protein (DUF1501 family)